MVLIPSFKRLLNPYQGYDLENGSPLTGLLFILLLSILHVTANSLHINGQHLAAKDFPSSHSSNGRRLVCPSAATICPEKENDIIPQTIQCHSHKDCSNQKICCWSNCWTYYTCQDPFAKLEAQNDHVQGDFKLHESPDEKYQIVSLSETSDAILENEFWTSSAENDTVIPEVKEEYSKAKRAANKNTAKPKKKHKHSVKNTNKKAQKNKKTVSETAKKSHPLKSRNQKKNAKKVISKHSNKNPVKNNKKSPKPNNKNPAKRVKSSARRAKIVEKPAKSKQKIYNKIKQTTKRHPTVLKSTKPPKKATQSATNSNIKKGKENNSEKKTYFRHRPLTSNDRDDCDSPISNGSFKLSFDVKPSDFFDERFQLNPNLKDEKCQFNIWNNKEINIIVMDIVMNQALRFKRTLKDDKLKEIIVHRRRGKKVRVRQQTNNETLEKITTISYRADESFDEPKSLLINEYESETVSYGADESFFRTESPLRKEHESETISNRAYASIVRLKPPLRMEESQKHHEKSKNWLVKQTTDQHHGDYRTVTFDENASGNNDKVFQESGTEERESSPSIQFESFTDLKNFINAKILKVKGPHMLLLSKKFDPLLSEKTNTKDFLSRLIEKLLKITTNFKITLSHFVPAKYIQKNTFYDILQTFQVSTEINPLSSNVENKSYVTQRVSETCVSIPLLRKSFFRISTSLQASVQLKLLNSKSLSKEYAGDLQGQFVLQMKQPCKAMEPPVSLTQNRTEKDQKAVRDMKSSTADLDSAATSQPSTNSAIQYRIADGKQFFPERTYQQQSVGIDYWMPEEVFGILFSKLFVNTTMPQGVHKIFGSKATTSGIETPNQLPINNPPISQRESGEPEENNELHTVEDGNFRSLFKSKWKQAASNNEKIAGNDGADVYYEFRDGTDGDFTLDKGRLTPPDDDSFIESPADNEYEISQQEFGFEKRDSVMDNYHLDDFHGSFQLKRKGKTYNNEEVSIGNNHRLLNHYSNHLLNRLESQDKDSDDSTMRKKYQSMKPESPVNNSTKQKNFLGMFKLKSSFKTSNTQEPLNKGTFIEPLKDINRLILELKQKTGRGKNTSDNNENDFFEGMFKLKTKNEGLSNTESEIVLANPTDSSAQTEWLSWFLLKSTPNPESYLGNGDLPDPSVNVDKLFAKQKKHKPLKENYEVENFHGIFRLKQKVTKNTGLSSNVDSILGNGGFAEPSVDIDKAVAEQKKHQSVKDNHQVENFHGIFALKKNEIKNIRLNTQQYKKIIDLLKDENELNEEDKGDLVKICKSLRHGSPLHASNQNKFHGLFRLKPKLRRESFYQVKPYQKLTSAEEFEPELMEKFHGVFRIKTEQELGEKGKVPNATMSRDLSLDENTFRDKYEVVFRLKPRKNESDSLGKLYKLRTFPEWCKNYKRRKEPFWFS